MIRGLAHIVSIAFHPILIATYMLFLIMWINPYLFGVSHWSERSELIVLLLPTSVIIPVICVLMMKPLGFIQSYQMKEREERIIPYITTAILIDLHQYIEATLFSTGLCGFLFRCAHCFISDLLYQQLFQDQRTQCWGRRPIGHDNINQGLLQL